MRTASIRTLLSATLTLLLSLAAPAGMWTLCLGQGGHTAVEVLGADCCVGPAAHVLDSASLSAADCGTCRDVPIGISELGRIHHGTHAPSLESSQAAFTTDVSPSQTAASIRTSLRSLHLDRPPSSLNSPVLRR